MVSSHPRSRLTLLAVSAGILLGIGFRVYVLAHHTGGFDSDEAVTGLIARHVLSHPFDHQAFFWGQSYGGTLAPIVAALPFAVFGSSATVLKLTEVLWHAVAALLVWRIGRRLLDDRAGVVAGVITWIWPALSVQWSTKARGFYGTIEVLGLVLLLYALRLRERPDNRADWLIFGTAAGLGWWTNPQIVYLAVPAGIWLMVGNRAALRLAFRTKTWLWALPGAVAGAAPWIYWNLYHHWSSLNSDKGNPGINRAEGFIGHLERLGREGIPVALGLKEPYSYRWNISPGIAAKALYLTALATIVVALLVPRGRRGALLLAVALVAYPVLHALGPVAGVTAEGRYFFCFMPLLALALARLVRTRLVAAVLFPVLLASTVLGVGKIPPGNAGATSGALVPRSMAPLIASLKAEHVNAVFANYWIAYRLTFESREHVIASGVDTERYRPYGEFVRRSPAPAWVFLENTLAESGFRAALDRLGIESRLWRTGGFSIYVPASPVHPEQLLPAEAAS
jgi:4-amino-4-deoxy-L-arabinose transferase-like glycosyltransferase